MSESMKKRKSVWLRVKKVCAGEGIEERDGGELLGFPSHFT